MFFTIIIDVYRSRAYSGRSMEYDDEAAALLFYYYLEKRDFSFFYSIFLCFYDGEFCSSYFLVKVCWLSFVVQPPAAAHLFSNPLIRRGSYGLVPLELGKKPRAF